MAQVKICSDFWDLFPDAAIGMAVVRNIPTSDALNSRVYDEISKFLAESVRDAQAFDVNPTFSQNPVVAIWREAYTKFPKKKGARCSFENLFKRSLRDSCLPSISPTVDISNAISLKYGLPIGAENIDALVGDLRIAKANGDEDFEPLGEGKQDPPVAGELCYLDDEGAVCRCLNWRDGVRTSVSDTTPHQIFLMECIDPERVDALKQAIDELCEKLATLLGAEITSQAILTRELPTHPIS